MNKFRELYIRIDYDQTDEFIRMVSSSLPPEWKRDLEREHEVSSFSGQKMYCFDRAKNDGLDAKLWIASDHKYNLRVSNVVPTQLAQLKIADYNKVVEEFYSFSLETIVKKLDGSIELTSDIFSIDDIASVDVAKSIRFFSSYANKSTGNSHPSDRNRWFEFLVLSYKSGKRLAPDELQKFLSEDGWTEDVAFELACEYETSLELLEFFER